MGNCIPFHDRNYRLYKVRKQNAASWPTAPAKTGLENGSTLTGCSSPALQNVNIQSIQHSVLADSQTKDSSTDVQMSFTNSASSNRISMPNSCNGYVSSHSQSLSIIPPILQNGDPVKMKAIYDYHRRTTEEISLVKGDIVLVLNNIDHEWWLVEHQGTRARGFVPTSYLAVDGSVESEDWFVRNIRRKDAVRLLLLRDNPVGTFMVRECESATDAYSLSIRDTDSEESVKHYKIRVVKTSTTRNSSDTVVAASSTGEFTKGSVLFNITSRHTFSTLQALIEFYSAGDHGLCCRLTLPCPRTPPLTSDLSYKTKDHWEISRESITLIERLGGGQFGDVYKGKWNDSVMVAVKTMRPGAMSKDDFLKEARLMKDLNHPKLVKLYAVCSEDPIYIITELMNHGSLLEYLHSDIGKDLELSTLVDIISQIASGMSYLEKKHYIHRDLAARNILVTDNNVVKVADFGLARMMKDKNDTYEAKQGTKFPIKWTAPEAALVGRFTIKSDVWSFGIVVYEVITRGGVPYPSMNNTETLRQVDEGYRMPCPAGCPSAMYDVVLETWKVQPEQRPTFEYLAQYFEDFFVRAAEKNYKKTNTLLSAANVSR